MVVVEGLVVWDDVIDFSVKLAEVECLTTVGLVAVADGKVVCDVVPVFGVFVWAVCLFGDDVTSEDSVPSEDSVEPVPAEMIEC